MTAIPPHSHSQFNRKYKDLELELEGNELLMTAEYEREMMKDTGVLGGGLGGFGGGS